MKDFKRGVEGMKNERWTIHVKIDGHTIARGKRGVRKWVRDLKRMYHREMRRVKFDAET
jgi:hypothetical protein